MKVTQFIHHVVSISSKTEVRFHTDGTKYCVQNVYITDKDGSVVEIALFGETEEIANEHNHS